MGHPCQKHPCMVVHGVKPGPKQYLSPEEETEIAHFAIECASAGCGQTQSQIMAIVEKGAKKKGVLRRTGFHKDGMKNL